MQPSSLQHKDADCQHYVWTKLVPCYLSPELELELDLTHKQASGPSGTMLGLT